MIRKNCLFYFIFYIFLQIIFFTTFKQSVEWVTFHPVLKKRYPKLIKFFTVSSEFCHCWTTHSLTHTHSQLLFNYVIIALDLLLFLLQLICFGFFHHYHHIFCRRRCPGFQLIPSPLSLLLTTHLTTFW